MDELNQVLERMRKAYAEKEQKSDILPMPPLGSTSDVGKLTIQPKEEKPKENPSGQQQQKNISPHTQAEKNELAKTLAVVCAMQKQYGKTTAELPTLVEGFCMMLPHRSMVQITEAIKKYVLIKNDIPTPADIENIINPPKTPLSGALYIQIMKDCTTGGKLLYGDKKDFVQAYEAQEMAKVRGGSDELREAKREIENHTRMLGCDED